LPFQIYVDGLNDSTTNYELAKSWPEPSAYDELNLVQDWKRGFADGQPCDFELDLV